MRYSFILTPHATAAWRPPRASLRSETKEPSERDPDKDRTLHGCSHEKRQSWAATWCDDGGHEASQSEERRDQNPQQPGKSQPGFRGRMCGRRLWREIVEHEDSRGGHEKGGDGEHAPEEAIGPEEEERSTVGNNRGCSEYREKQEVIAEAEHRTVLLSVSAARGGDVDSHDR